MNFRHFYIVPREDTNRDLLRAKLRMIDPSMSEVPNPGIPSVLVIDDPINHKSHEYVISPELIEELVKSQSHEFPLSQYCHRLASLCLSTTKLSFSGIEKEYIVSLCEMAQLLGAKIVTDSFTLLICGEPLSSRHLASLENGIPTVTPLFLVDCYRQKKLLPISDYIMKPFYKLQFTSTNLTPSEQKQLKVAVESKGGIWTQKLTQDTRFLIARSLNLSEKTKTAIRYSIPIIPPLFVTSNPPTNPYQIAFNYWSFDSNSDLFAKKTFSIHFSLDVPFFEGLIQANGGLIGPNPDYQLCPIQYDGDTSSNVTPEWLLACITNRIIMPTTESVFFVPVFSPRKPVFQGKTISILIDKERDTYIDVVRSLGGTAICTFSKESFVWVADRNESLVMRKAREMGVTVVAPKFIIDCLEKGEIVEKNEHDLDERKRLLRHLATKLNSPHSPKKRCLMESVDMFEFTQNNGAEVDQEAQIFLEQPEIVDEAIPDQLDGELLRRYLEAV